ncbi:histidinol-phosphate transaminase [Flavobacterium psychrotrophum]|uniref:histidinol-phosphate transaminase n=1 Tax=Flavobacterium psychrotrophum TaxID=2294119 RepID=UPI000E322E1D|nr:histidinol-phosphate transaminase [Flavobacterium psychrotrophum]
MFDLSKIVRPNIRVLQPYSSARDEFKGTAAVYLDANENPFGTLNRYPDPLQKQLKASLSEIKAVDTQNIFVDNGSDEAIDLCFRIFCEPGKDRALTFTPTYGMYKVSADINNVVLDEVPLDDNFQIDIEKTLPLLEDERLKLIFICSPNNPTGNNLNNIETILQNFNGIVVVDEAYIDFSENESLSQKIAQYPNLVVLQTLSKAWGLAAARIGLALADANIISLFNKVKPPYNVSRLNYEAAIAALGQPKVFEQQKQLLLQQRTVLQQELINLPFVTNVYPSNANFLLVAVTDASGIYNRLVEKGIILRNRNSVIANCIRITIGTPEENELLLTTLKNLNL